MQMMMTSGKTYTRESLKSDIVSAFGQEARFFTCSAENMTPEQLMDFLETKGKFVPAEAGRFQTLPELMCKH